MPSNWQGQIIRFSLFPATPWDIAAFEDVWGRFSNDPAELDEHRPRERVRRRAGTYKEGVVLEIGVSPQRVDIVFSPATTPQGQGESLGPFEPLLREVAPHFAGWVENFPFDLSRGAVGLTLMDPAESRIASYQKIMEFAKSLTIDLSEPVSDLLFQINHPIGATSKDGLTINRLMKFGAILRTSMAINFDNNAPTIVEGAAPPRHFTTIELDINTAPGTTLERASLRTIFQELLDISFNLAAHGEP